MGKLGAGRPAQLGGHHNTERKQMGRISLSLSTTSQYFHSTERENCAFKVRTIRMRILELYHIKAKEEAGGTTSSRIPTQPFTDRSERLSKISPCFLAHTRRPCQV